LLASTLPSVVIVGGKIAYIKNDMIDSTIMIEKVSNNDMIDTTSGSNSSSSNSSSNTSNSSSNTSNSITTNISITTNSSITTSSSNTSNTTSSSSNSNNLITMKGPYIPGINHLVSSIYLSIYYTILDLNYLTIYLSNHLSI
jgi:hypothetical protein